MPMVTSRHVFMCAALLTVGLFVIGCGNPPPIVGGETPFSLGGDSQVKGFAPTPTAFTSPPAEGDHGALEPRPTEPTGAQAPPIEGGLEVSALGNELKFDKPSMSAKGSGKTTVTLYNKASSASLQHNWVLAKLGTVEAVAVAGLSAGPSNAWVAPNDPNVIAHSKLVDGGKSGSVTFDAPQAGKYAFLCSFPGHSGTMNGEFVVE